MMLTHSLPFKVEVIVCFGFNKSFVRQQLTFLKMCSLVCYTYVCYWRYEAMASVSDKELLHHNLYEYVTISQYHPCNQIGLLLVIANSK